MLVNVWIVLSDQAITEFKDRRDNPDTYDGPMDKKTFMVLSKMEKSENTQRLFKTTAPIGGKVYTLFSIYCREYQVEGYIDYLTEQWPSHFIVVGAWEFNSGLQLGTVWVDEEDPGQGWVGTPDYPIHAQAWRVMPDFRDGDGNVTGSPSSNADLRDVHLVAGQAPRVFT